LRSHSSTDFVAVLVFVAWVKHLGFFGFVFIFTFGVWIRLGRFLGLFLLIFLGLFAAFRFFLVFWLAFGSFSLLFVFGVFDGLLFC